MLRFRSAFLAVFVHLTPVFLFVVAAGMPTQSTAQTTNLDKLSEDELRQIKIAERFLTVLQRNPRRGTALDRIYGHHVEFGTLDAFLGKLRKNVQDSPQDGVGWMLLGLFDAHRGEDADAILAFQNAERLRPQDALASYYLGQSQLLLGQPEKAVAAFNRAIERQPRRTDLLEIFQQLGRVHQRAQRTEEALQVWQRLEALFPNDARVLEQIAITLVEEGEFALALPRYQKLAELVQDDYRRTMFRMEVAELKIRENDRQGGLADFEKLIADLNPEGWLFRDVRRRIEDVFVRDGNQDGLVEYYEKWIASHPEDVDAMARAAKYLASSARVPEAAEWMRKALKLAPTRSELRKAFIDQLVDDQRYPDAIKQYELLLASAPGNVDFLRDWGKLVLKNKELTPEKRQAEATRIWKKILAARTDDAITIAQVADLFRQSNMNDQALSLYQQAVAQAPNQPQYREYLGEFYHILKRPEDALATWTAIAEGERHTAGNVARLAEIYNSFGYLDEAASQIADACRLDPKDFSLQLKAADYHARSGEYKQALAFIDHANKLAATADEQESVITQRIEVFRASRSLDEEITALAAVVLKDKNAASSQWRTLARYYQADNRWADAAEAIDTALKKDPKSISALSTAAHIAELSGDFARAAAMNRRLAVVDRRSRGDHLMNVARLEAQLGRADEALQAARELIVSAPGNTDNYEFYAQLCFQLGKAEEGVKTLRKAVRINPTEPYLIMSLGAALSRQFRTDEAIEVYWRAFEKTDELDDQTSLTVKLTELYLQLNQFDKLLDRLKRDRRSEDKRRAMTICLAQAHQTSGDYGTARQELESLLSDDTRDTNLLQQLSKLCEAGSDLDAATNYQRQLAAIAPGHETEFRLSKLLQEGGLHDEASEILLQLMQREENPIRRLRNLDSLLKQGAYENVISLTEQLLSEQRDDWELRYREAVAWASLDKFAEARVHFERLLAVNAVHETMGIVAAEKFKQARSKARSKNRQGVSSRLPTRRSPLAMLGSSAQIRRAAGLDTNNNFGGSRGATSVWTPNAFGEARMAAYAWLMRIEQERENRQETKADENNTVDENNAWEDRLQKISAAATADDANRETIYDWMYVEQLRGNLDSIFAVARRLAKAGGRESQQFFLQSLMTRGVNQKNALVAQQGNAKPQKKPLAEDDLELMLACYKALTSEADSTATPAAFGRVIISRGQTYVQIGGSWTPISNVLAGGAFTGTVIEELKLAGRTEQAGQMLQKQIDAADSSAQLAAVMNFFLANEEYDRIDELFPKWLEAAHADIAKGPNNSTLAAGRTGGASKVVDPLAPAANLLMNWMAHLGPQEENAKILSLLDHALEIGAEVARQRRAEQSQQKRKRSATNTTSRSTYFQLKYGQENIQAQIQYPQPNEYVDPSSLMLLREVYEVFKRNDVLDDLPEHLAKRLLAAGDDDKLYATLMLAYSRWWLEEKDEALELLSAAGALRNDDLAFRLEIASLHQAMGNFEDALEIVEAIAPRDQKLVQRRELLVLDLAERLGDVERARQAAERLFGLRLASKTQSALIEQMRRLGMHEMAEAMVSRVRRRSSNDLASLASLMTLYQGQGKIELARQLAHTILRRTKSPLSNMNASGRNPFRYGTSNNSQMRTQALQLLHRTGALKELIAKLESQLERSPNSPQLYAKLIEYYESSNNREKVEALLVKAVAARPDAVVFRYQLAKHFVATGKHDEACDQYLELLKQKPQWVAEELYQIGRVFEQAKRSLDLVQAFEKINLKQFSQPYYVINLVTNLMRGRRGEPSEAEMTLALNLFEKAFEAFPQYRNNMMSNLSNPKLWKLDRVYQLGKRAVVPSVNEAATTPWYGLTQISSYSQGGKVNVQFHQVLEGVHGTDNLPDFRKAIETRLQEAPQWLGGEAMLGLIELKENQKQQARRRLEKLVSNEETLKAMPSAACWIIGQELDQFAETRPLAITLLEAAIKKGNSMQQMQYSPVAKLIKLYDDMGRSDEARNLLLKQLRSPSENAFDPFYSSYQRVENSVWAGRQLLKLDSPVDAVRIFRELSQDEAVEQAGQWQRNQPDYFKNQVTKGLNDALAALDAANAPEAMAQLLAVPKKLAKGAPILDLLLIVPSINDARTKPMESPLVDLLVAISKEKTVVDGIRQRLAVLQAEHPADLSVRIVEAAFLLRIEHEQAPDSLRALLAALESQPLETIKTGRRPNSRQRREALAQVPLWLIARECLAAKERQEIGEAFAARALQAARRQIDNQHTAAILHEWANNALERNDRPQAEAKWAELLAVAAQSGAKSKTPSKTHRIPPLTLSKFRLAINIGHASAENEMPALSRKAVQAAMRGGMPVKDVAKSSSNSGRGVIVFSAFGGSTSAESNLAKLETEVATSLRKVIAQWQGDAYPAKEVYALLRPIVLPENRSGEILMYGDSSKLFSEAQVSSLGEVLVQWALRSDQSEQLSAELEARKKNSRAKIAALVLQTQMALSQNKLDDAKTALVELAKEVKQRGLPPIVQLACHAALPASEHESLAKPAFEILQAAINMNVQSAAASSNNGQLSLGRLVSKVNRHLATDPQQVSEFFEKYLIGRQSRYASHSGSYRQHLQRQDLAAIAEEAAKTGLPHIALDYMARVADLSISRYSRPSTAIAMAVIYREMSRLPAEQRYEAWRNWTLPAKGRQTVRFTADWVEPVRAPQAFLKLGKRDGQLHATDLLSNFTELAAAAEESGRLEELRGLAEDAYEKKLENAAFLFAILLAKTGDFQRGKEVIEPLVATIVKRLKPQPGQSRPDGMSDYLVYRACMQSAQFSPLYRANLVSVHQAFRNTLNARVLGHLPIDLALREFQTDPPTIRPGDDPQLAHWQVFSTKKITAGGTQPWWEVHEGQIAHLSGAGSDFLSFAYPLTGDFEFTVEAYYGSWAEADFGYGGAVVEAQKWGSRMPLWSIGGHESLYLPAALRGMLERFTTLKIQVADGKMRQYLNNALVYEEEVSDTSPWLTLFTDYARATTFRNPRITGNPTIPREVSLINGDRMDGWNTSFFGESQPHHRLMALKIESENQYDSQLRQQQAEPSAFDWQAADGALVGRKSTRTQSWAYYQRPLRDQESFHYEFFYTPGESVAHPTIGRIALLLEPAGVDEHWLTRPDWDEPVLGIVDDNRLANPAARRGPKKLPLKPDDWNRVGLTLAGRTLRVVLNGDLVYERTVEPEIDLQVGLYRGKGRSLRVRELKLAGLWPETLTAEIRNNMLASNKQYTPADRRLLHDILGERFFIQDAAPLVARARQLPEQQAYDELRAWVLASPDHANHRLYFEFVSSAGSARQQIICPATELMSVAQQTGKLAELAAQITAIDMPSESGQRNKIGLLALLAMQRQDFVAARQGMAQLNALAAKGFPQSMSPHERASEFVVAWQAAKHPELQFAAFDLSQQLLLKQRDAKTKAKDGKWDKWANMLGGHIDEAMRLSSQPTSNKPRLTQWANVPYYKPDMHKNGLRHTEWEYSPGVVDHIPGGTWGQLFFQSPLEGDFEINVQRTMHGYREAAITYGMHSAEPRYDFKATRVVNLMHAVKDEPGKITIPNQGNWLADFRIVVKNNKVRTFVNGTQIHEESFSQRPDPWLVLQAYNAGFQSSIRNLRISGNPKIPDQLDLINFASWGAWRADMYGDSLSLDADNESAPWKKADGEIQGRLRENVLAAPRQSLLMYQRPMLEDGVIEFESYYIPGESEVHPAVGRTALLISTDGVKKHLLTDAQFETNGLAPGNSAPIEGAAKKIALKQRDWNRYRLSLKGDQLTIAVNGEDVATVTLTELAAQRYFGLFRYSNKTKCRVRNLVYRGEWPKTLPAVEDQQLARASAENQFAAWPELQAFDFTEPISKLQAKGLEPGGAVSGITSVEGGTRLLLQNADGYAKRPRLHLRQPISEDCVITLDFEGFKIQKPKEGWGAYLVLRAAVDTASNPGVETSLGVDQNGNTNVRSVRGHKTLAGKASHESRHWPISIAAGRLRLVRQGSTISAWFAEPNSNDFRLLETWPVGEAPIKEIIIQCAASHATARVDVVLKRLTIQTRKPSGSQ